MSRQNLSQKIPLTRRNTAGLLLITVKTLQSGSGDPLIDAGADTEEGYACRADGEGGLGVQVALEGGHRTVGLGDVHGLHNQQIVVE